MKTRCRGGLEKLMRKTKIAILLFLCCSIIASCGSSNSEEPAAEEPFEGGQPSTVVTGANLTSVTPDCVHDQETDSNFQNLSCKLLIASLDDATETQALLNDEINVVTAVEGVDISWGIPPDLDFTCFRVKQSIEIFCFRESAEEIEDFNVLLSVTSLDDQSVTLRAITTAVSKSIDQTETPAAPSSLTATTLSSTQINLGYADESDNETQFSIERSPDNTTWAQIAVVGSNIEAYANTGLSPSTTYYYRVKACNSAGCSAPSSVSSDTTDASGGSDQRIFATSSSWTGNLGGISGAHTLCNTAATAASLVGNWKAIISAPNSGNANVDLIISAVVRNMNGDKVADDASDLWDGTIDAAIGYNEFGASVNKSIWTGTSTTGIAELSSNACVDWTTSTGIDTAAYGHSTQSTGQWIIGVTPLACSNSYGLYCIDGQ